MKNFSMYALFAVLSGLASVSLAADSAAQPVTTVTQMGSATTTFSCSPTSGKVCHYLIVSSICQETLLAGGAKERRCTYSQAVPPFQLKAGEPKTITHLPADFLYTMRLDRAPTIEECIAAPIAH